MTATLPGVGTVAARWRSVLGPVMTGLAGDGLVVDGRSSSYASVWRPTGAAAKAYVAVRVFSEVDGRRTVVSHAAKHTRGLVARWVCEADRTPRTPTALAALVAEHRPCALVPDPRGGWFLDVDAPRGSVSAHERPVPRTDRAGGHPDRGLPALPRLLPRRRRPPGRGDGRGGGAAEPGPVGLEPAGAGPAPDVHGAALVRVGLRGSAGRRAVRRRGRRSLGGARGSRRAPRCWPPSGSRPRPPTPSSDATRLDEVGQPGERWDGEPPATLERVLLHVLQEHARHLGHLDVVAELGGGVTGEA